MREGPSYYTGDEPDKQKSQPSTLLSEAYALPPAEQIFQPLVFEDPETNEVTSFNPAPSFETTPQELFDKESEVTELQEEEASTDIYDHYLIDGEYGEVEFLINNFDESDDPTEQARIEGEKRFYTEENIGRFINEYVIKEPYNSVAYPFKNGKVHYGNIPWVPKLYEATEKRGKNSRTGLENVGQIQMFEAQEQQHENRFDNNQNWMVISPPKGWNYGFIFYQEVEINEKLEDPLVRVHMVRYNERKNQIRRSSEILSALDPSLSFTTTEQYLTTPLLNPPGFKDLNGLKRIAGITEQELQHAENLRSIIFPHIQPLINDYSSAVMQLADDRKHGLIDQVAYLSRVDDLKINIAGIRNKAEEIKEQYELSLKTSNISGKHAKDFTYTSKVFNTVQEEALYFAQSRSLKIIGGGSCEGDTKKDRPNLFVSNGEMMKSIGMGTSISEMIKEKADHLNDPNLCKCGNPGKAHFHCPGDKEVSIKVNGKDENMKKACKHPIIVGEGTTKCPGCNLDATCK